MWLWYHYQPMMSICKLPGTEWILQVYLQENYGLFIDFIIILEIIQTLITIMLYAISVLKVIPFKNRQHFNAGRAAELFPFPKKIKENNDSRPPGKIVGRAAVFLFAFSSLYAPEELWRFRGSFYFMVFDNGSSRNRFPGILAWHTHRGYKNRR